MQCLQTLLVLKNIILTLIVSILFQGPVSTCTAVADGAECEPFNWLYSKWLKGTRVFSGQCQAAGRLLVYCRQKNAAHNQCGMFSPKVVMSATGSCLALKQGFYPVGRRHGGSWCIEKWGHSEQLAGFVVELLSWRSPFRSCWSAAEFKLHVCSAT